MIELLPFSDRHSDRRRVFQNEVRTYRRNAAFILGAVMWIISMMGFIALMTHNWWLTPLIFLNIFGVAFIYDSVVAHFCDKLLETQSLVETNQVVPDVNEGEGQILTGQK